jgi:invasion protein IalB
VFKQFNTTAENGLLTAASKLATLCILGVGLLTSAAVNANETTFGDWKMQCQPTCVLTQNLTDTVTPGLRFAVQLAKIDESKSIVVQLNFPLGVYLQKPIGLAIGAYRTEVPMTVCLPSGCKAVFEMSADMRVALLSQPVMHVGFFATEAKPNKITFLLSGVAEGLAELEKGGATVSPK